jgi:hypothetical protein
LRYRKEVDLLGKVHQLQFRKKEYEYENCNGCQKKVEEDQESYMEVVLPYDDYDKHILLCPKCYRSAKRFGAL